MTSKTRKVAGWNVKVEFFKRNLHTDMNVLLGATQEEQTVFAFGFSDGHKEGSFTITYDGKNPPTSLDIHEAACKWIKVSLPVVVTSKAATMASLLTYPAPVGWDSVGPGEDEPTGSNPIPYPETSLPRV